MAFRLVPGLDISQSVRQAGTEQIDRALAKLSGKAKKSNAIHETRKSMKRLRALLHLVRPAMRKADFRRDEARLKHIARSLAGARDTQAMLETVAKLDAYDERVGRGPVAVKLRAQLEAKHDTTGEDRKGSGVSLARRLLKEARAAFDDIVLEKDDFKILASTIERDYRKARRAFHRAYELQEDEAFHDWRKYVQRHWRQLLLVAPSWPKALRPHIALARDLSEVLGEDHDLFVLANFVRTNLDGVANKDVEAYLDLCRRRQNELRSLARGMGARLFAEKPSSLAARLTTYWITAPSVDEAETEEEEDGAPSNVIPLSH